MLLGESQESASSVFILCVEANLGSSIAYISQVLSEDNVSNYSYLKVVTFQIQARKLEERLCLLKLLRPIVIDDYSPLQRYRECVLQLLVVYNIVS